MNLKDLFPSFITEDKQFECKSRLNHDDVFGWIKTIGGFANAQGGTLFLGVEDKTYKIIGFSQDELDKEKHFFFQSISQHFPSQPVISVKPLSYLVNNKERFILIITVYESSLKPIIVKYKEMPMIFVRRDGYTNSATAEEIREMSISSDFVSFDKQITDIKYDKKDFTKLNTFFAERHEGKNISDKELASIGFFNEDKNLTKGAYLFSDKYEGDETKTVCSLYKGMNRGDNSIIISNSFSGNLIDSFRFMWEFIDERTDHGFIKSATGRVDIDAYPKRALFEALINALAHRNYFLSGSQISVDVFPNRIVISSPGSLFNGGEIIPTCNFDSFISRRRNELICNVLVLCKAMEAKGTGFERIKEEYAKHDQRHKPFVFSKNNQFTIVLPDIINRNGVDIANESLIILGEIVKQTRFDVEILSYCIDTSRTIKDIALHLGISDSSFLRKNVLENLVKQSYLLESVKGRSKEYISNRALVSIN